MLKTAKVILITFIVLFNTQVKGQDSVYAKSIDSLWQQSYKRQELFSKKEKLGKTEFDYSFYKSTCRLRSIVAFKMPIKPELFLFYYLDDNVVMISPVGQQPYYILNNVLVYAKERRHGMEEIQSLISMANDYRLQAYRKIAGK